MKFFVILFATVSLFSDQILPFGVENIYGKTIEETIQYPQSVQEVREIVAYAIHKNKQVSVIGAGMCQGEQTLPAQKEHIVIHTKYLNSISIDSLNNTATVGAGTTWEQLLLELDAKNKSVLVKQASDIFSIGGSVAINCHGWAHQYGSISKTVRSLKIVDSQGNLRTLTPPTNGKEKTEDEALFCCQFGTLGYFGIIVEVTFDIVDNLMVLQKVKEVDLDQFDTAYETIKNNPDISLFRGRFILDGETDHPLQKILMVEYHNMPHVPLRGKMVAEPEYGRTFERLGVNLITQLPHYFSKKLIRTFWKREKKALAIPHLMSRNAVLHQPINALKTLQKSTSYAQWLQEYFIERDQLPHFIRFLEEELKKNHVTVMNATIRPTPKDDISILPYADKDRYAVVLCFSQKKTAQEIEKTRIWIETINTYLAKTQGVFYQAYMPYATKEQFEACYSSERVEKMRLLKQQFDPHHVFGNGHTAKYFDLLPIATNKTIYQK